MLRPCRCLLLLLRPVMLLHGRCTCRVPVFTSTLLTGVQAALLVLITVSIVPLMSYVIPFAVGLHDM